MSYTKVILGGDKVTLVDLEDVLKVRSRLPKIFLMELYFYYMFFNKNTLIFYYIFL